MNLSECNKAHNVYVNAEFENVKGMFIVLYKNMGSTFIDPIKRDANIF